MRNNHALHARNQLLLPLFITYTIVGGFWVFYNYGDWIYLTFTLISLLLFMYLLFENVKRFKLIAYIHKKERSLTEEHIKHMAYYDDVTGLPNRRMFSEELSRKLFDMKEKGEIVAVMFINIDHFKLVNDSLGHDYGDILLLQVAERLSRKIKEHDFIARMVGDEFALFYSGLQHRDDAIERIQGIYKEIEPTFLLQEYQLHITISTGISILMNEDDNAQKLMKFAATALTRAKEKGRNNYQFFTPAMNTRSFERLTLENELRCAIEQKEFILHYQPQVNTSTGEIVGAEALIRWNHPIHGLILPGKFVPLAEENGMIIPIGEWAMYAACMQNKKWQDAGFLIFPVSVNLSTRQFQQHNLVEKVAEILEKTNLDPQYLELEITESMTMDVEHAIGTLHELKKLGIGISIDDFGKGYSSLNYLRKFPINKLKIDRSFVMDILEGPNEAAIVSTIIAMAHGLDLKVIAEGVETHEQLNYLSMNSCNEVQGYLFSPPLPVERFTERIKEPT